MKPAIVRNINRTDADTVRRLDRLERQGQWQRELHPNAPASLMFNSRSAFPR